jgi:replicative DNA helicase
MGKCVAWDTPMVDPATGEVRTAEAWYLAGMAGEQVRCTTLDDAGHLVETTFGGFYSDGVKPLFRVTTRSGRTIRITAEHPLLTGRGWQPLADIAVGTRIAVPRELPVFGTQHLPDAEVDLLADLARDKRVPGAVFTAPREQVARFLNRLFATDGTAWVAASGCARIAYATVSEQLSLDVMHLLLRFGIRAKRRVRSIAYEGTRRRSFEIEVMDAASLRRFATEIGIVGKEPAVERVVAAVSMAKPSFTIDTLPMDVWDDVVKAKGERTWAEVSRAAGKPNSHNWHPYRRRPRRDTIARLAEVLDCDVLRRWASEDVSWDEVVSIEACGEDRIYDFNVPGTHNFVAADVFVHNTAFGLGIATHVAMNAGRLVDSDWTKIGRAINRLEVPLFLDDNPRVTVMEIRAKARRTKARYGGLSLIVIDYLQLMSGGASSENRQLEVSEISRGLKILARELEVPIIALRQLSRNLEARADKRPMLADLRESGSLEQDADVVMFLYRDEVYNRETPDKGLAEVIIAKHRSGPTGVVRLVFNGAYTRYDNAAKGLN